MKNLAGVFSKMSSSGLNDEGRNRDAISNPGLVLWLCRLGPVGSIGLHQGAASVRRCAAPVTLLPEAAIERMVSAEHGTTYSNYINSLTAILAPSPTLCPAIFRRIAPP
jgi:hypothetical protein